MTEWCDRVMTLDYFDSYVSPFSNEGGKDFINVSSPAPAIQCVILVARFLYLSYRELCFYFDIHQVAPGLVDKLGLG